MNTTPSVPACRAIDAGLPAQLADTAVYWLTGRAHRLLERLEDALFELAVAATVQAEQDAFFDAMQRFRAGRGDFVARLQATVEEQLGQAFGPGPHARPVPAVSEDWQGVLAPVTDAACRRHADTLSMLNALLNGLLRDARFEDPAANPLGPALISRCVADALAPLGPPDALAPRVATEHAELVLGDIDELCTQCATLLVEAGVQARLARAARPQAAVRLAAAQRRFAATLGASRAEQAQRLGTLLLDEVQEDPRLAPAAACLFPPLRGHLVEALVEDAGFVAGDAHPLRRCLRAMGEFALGMPLAGPAADDPRLLAMRRLAVVLATTPCGAPDAQAGMQEFLRYAAGESHRARLAAHREGLAERGRGLLVAARAAVERVVATELGDIRLPPAAEELLREGWQRVLAHAWLVAVDRDDAGLLAALARFASLWRTGAARLPDTLSDFLHEAMVRAGADPLRAEILLRSVDEELAGWEPGHESAPALAQVLEDDPAAEPIAATPLVDALEEGDWLAFGADGAVRARLAARFADPPRLLFTDAAGHRVACLMTAELEQKLATGGCHAIGHEDPLEAALLRLCEGRSLLRSDAA